MLVDAPPPWRTQLQSLALKALARAPMQPKTLPLVWPRTMFHTGGTAIGGLYYDVFGTRQYASPKPLPAHPRIVDAGAHLGLASMFLLSTYPGCTLTAFEPNPNLAPLLRRNLRRWGAQATVVEAALSNHNGTASFHITEDNPFNVTGGIDNREDLGRAVRVHDVACVDAKERLSQPIDLMKLDVEGHEYELLRLELFRPTHVSNLIVEFHDIRQRREVFSETLTKLVDERGYRVADMHDVQLGLADLRQLDESTVLKLY